MNNCYIIKKSHTIIVFVVLICLCSTSILHVSAQQCTVLPDNGIGHCILLMDCPEFLNMVKNIHESPTPDEDRNFLRRNGCGFINHQVLVCCPIRTNKSNNELKQISRVGDHNSNLPRPPVCGKYHESRSTIKKNTAIDDYPWMALIEYTSLDSNEKSHLCIGSLINDRYVLTAAHCVSGYALSDKWSLSGVRLGEWDTATNPDCDATPTEDHRICAPPYLDIPIVESIIHPQYSNIVVNQANDIALLRLKDSVEYNDFVRPICLPLGPQWISTDFTNKIMEVAGWQDTTTKMYQSLVKIWNEADCSNTYNQRSVPINSTQICAAFEARNTDSDSGFNCRGNSGGPLMYLNSNAYVLAGISSFGPKMCGSQGWPDVYTRVALYTKWIEDSIRP